MLTAYTFYANVPSRKLDSNLSVLTLSMFTVFWGHVGQPATFASLQPLNLPLLGKYINIIIYTCLITWLAGLYTDEIAWLAGGVY